MKEPIYRRVLLKLSGEILSGEKGFGIDPERANFLAKEVKSIHKLGVGVGLIIGAGNIFRGLQAADRGMDRVTGDYLGMLATIMNAISVQDALEQEGCETRTLSALNITQIAEPYIRRRALRHLEKGRIVIVSGGTGNPFFTTDSAAALRAKELNAEIVIKGTKVDGIYNDDPVKNPSAFKYDQISYDKVLRKNLRVMDLTAITLCKENSIPIQVFNIRQTGTLKNLVLGGNIGTLVSG
ncbi:MAG: UMP kinase [Candidatus Marinimicrobia bacterium]|nr:UMP kinase [Candidatus Neomarinimicrobiota bacterium]|tara:strand:- start:1102 stop:1818 length:717 start_codon:yes stop_codon:yes gene_type:complete